MVVYLSPALKDYDALAYHGIVAALVRENIEIKWVKSLNPWIRDYLPVQVPDGSYTKFRYKDYGSSKYQKLPKFNVPRYCWHHIKPVFESSIVLDGGNCVMDFGRAYITKMVFKHNPRWKKINLIKELERLLQMHVVLLPVEPGDLLAHSDGILRGVNKNTVLVNNYQIMKEDKWYRYFDRLTDVLIKEKLMVDLMPFAYDKCPKMTRREFIKAYPMGDQDSYNPAVGYYCNFLHLGDAVIAPKFGFEEDGYVAFRLSRYFKRVYMVNCYALAMYGGLCNCVTREYEVSKP